MSVVEFQREPDAGVIELLESALERAKAGDLVEVVIVGNLPAEGGFLTLYSIADRWRLLGALEYAKHRVNLDG